MNMTYSNCQRICRVVGPWSLHQSQKRLYHLLHLGFVGSPVTTDCLLHNDWGVLMHLQLCLSKDQHCHTGGLADSQRRIYMLANKEFLHRCAFRAVERQKLRKLVREIEQPFGLRKLGRCFNYPILNRSKGPVPLLFYDPVTGSSNPGINPDYEQDLKLLGCFQKRYSFFSDVKVREHGLNILQILKVLHHAHDLQRLSSG